MDPRSATDPADLAVPFQTAPPEDRLDDLEEQTVAPSPSRSGKPKGKGSPAWLNIALGVALFVAVGGVSFLAGRLTAPATTGNFPRNFPGGNGYFGGGQLPGGGARTGGLSLEGTVVSVSGSTLTLKLTSGQTMQVTLSGTTTYHAQTNATASNVASGSTVIVRVQGFQPDPGNGGTGGGGTTATDVTVVP